MVHTTHAASVMDDIHKTAAGMARPGRRLSGLRAWPFLLAILRAARFHCSDDIS